MTQTQAILNYLRTGKKITPIEALNKFGSFRLGARVYEIKQMGFDVKSQIVKGKHFAEYSL